MFGRGDKRVDELGERVAKYHDVLATLWAKVAKIEAGTDDGTRALVARVDRLEAALRTSLGVDVEQGRPS